MKLKLLSVIGCPKCRGPIQVSAFGGAASTAQDIGSGRLECAACALSWPIVDGIPRFVSSQSYAESFGLQWNKFRTEQIDSVAGISQSARRWHAETGWSRDEMRGKWVLDAGCGAGRFLDVVSRTGAEVVGIDLSSAVDAAARTLADRPNVHLIQASIYELPFREGVFDACYCIGVVQHTPDPVATARSLPRVLKAGGRLAVSMYERRRFTLWNGKYLVRPATKRLPPQVLLGTLRVLMPLLWLLTEILFRIPVLGRYFRFFIPVANYVDVPELTWRQRYRWAILDTFDMLAPAYDQPLTEETLVGVLRSEGIRNIHRTSPKGLCVAGDR